MLDKALWLAVRTGDVESAARQLDDGADPNCFLRAEDLEDEEDKVLVYKSRKLACAPLHVAAMYPCLDHEEIDDMIDDSWLHGEWVDRQGKFYNGRHVSITAGSWQPLTCPADAFHNEGATYWRSINGTAVRPSAPGHHEGANIRKANESASIRATTTRAKSLGSNSSVGHGQLRLFERRADGKERCYELDVNADGTILVRFRGGFQDSSLIWTLHRVVSPGMNASLSGTSGHASLVPPPAFNKSRKLCELLLDKKAKIDMLAAHAAQGSSAGEGGDVRVCQAIHLAAGTGNKRALELLLERGAQANAEATLNGHLHYLPLHDAAWFNQLECARVLIEQRALIDAQNNRGETALHIASKHGYSGLVKLFLERHENPEELLLMETKKLEIPLDMALRRGYFPLRELNLFTQNLGHDGLIRAFNAAATCCPSAVFWILRSGGPSDERDFQMNAEWRQSLQKAARESQITVRTLSRLMARAPDAALCLLDALTERPAVEDQQHNPLPVRALLPRSICGAPIWCEYEPATSWEWTQENQNPTGKPQGDAELGMNAWQARLAPPDSCNGVNVDVRVCMLTGIICLEAIYGLARASDPRIFSKPVVQATLQFAWKRLMPMFIVDLVHQVICIIVLYMWASGVRIACMSLSVNLFIKYLMWAILASHGMTQILTCGFEFWNMYRTFSFGKAFKWLRGRYFRVVFGCFSIALAVCMIPSGFQPDDQSSNVYRDELLSTNCLLHCCNLLMDFRAFEDTGYKLLPIMKSVQPIVHMLGIMLVILLGFALAFSSVSDDKADQPGLLVNIWQVAFMAFTGEPLQEGDHNS
jgi:hypothetical protein